jgi:AcrR family transcriptional regulator
VGRTPIVSRDKIIDAARKLFTRYGYDKTTIQDIGKLLNVGKSSLYYYFKDKDEIFKVILDADIKAIKNAIEQELAGVLLPQDKLKAYVLLRMNKVKELTGIYTTFKDEYQKNYQAVQEIREGYDSYEVGLIRSILGSGVESGIFSMTADINLASAAIFSAIKGMEFDWAVNIDASSSRKNITALLDILLFGIMKNRKTSK